MKRFYFAVRAIAAAALFGGSAAPSSATMFDCQTKGCANYAWCDGEKYQQSTCAIQCYVVDEKSGELSGSGSANCAS